VSKIIRLPLNIYSRLEQHAQGFDAPANVIEKLLNHYEGKAPIEEVLLPAPRGKDTTKYYFQNVKYGKGRLVLAVIKDYVLDHPAITLAGLRAIFSKNLQGSIGVFNELEQARKQPARHYVQPEEIINIGDVEVAVCNQWGIRNIDNFISKAEELGYFIKRASDS